MSNSTLLSADQAYQCLMTHRLSFSQEMVPLSEAVGRILAEDLTYTIAQPPFNKAAMDGYAYNTQELYPKYCLLKEGMVAAGDKGHETTLADGEAIPIMTGAVLPAGTKAVQRVEWTEQTVSDGQVRVLFTQQETSKNIITRGQNGQIGDILLQKKLLGPADLAILASSGYARVPVVKKLRVAVLSSGSELRPVDEILPEGAIYDTNSYYLMAYLNQCGVDAHFYGIVKDDYSELLAKVQEAAALCDVIILSGGISVGALDYTKKVFQELQVKEIFHGLAVKPGKPLFFGKKDEQKAFFGLPGNPLSAFTCCVNFIKPFLYTSMGLPYHYKDYRVPLATAYQRKDSSRAEYLPARLYQGPKGPEAELLPYYGSSMLSVLAATELFVIVEKDVNTLAQGELVHARFL